MNRTQLPWALRVRRLPAVMLSIAMFAVCSVATGATGRLRPLSPTVPRRAAVTAATATVLPTPPTPVVPPSPTTPVVVPPSFRVAGVVPDPGDGAPLGYTCPATHAATLDQLTWTEWLTSVARLLGLPGPTSAPMPGLRIEFPPGCYYLDGTVSLDDSHPFVDVVLDGTYTGQPADSPQFIQTNTPDCDTGTPMLAIQNVATARVALEGFTLQGSAPEPPPYCGAGPSGLLVGGLSLGSGPHDVTVEGNIIRDNWGDNLYVTPVEGLDVANNLFYMAGRDSISVIAGTDQTYTGNFLISPQGFGFNIETVPNLDGVARVLVAYNDAELAVRGLLLNATAFWGTTVQDVMFASNVTSSPLIMWTGAVLGGLEHRLAFIGNIGRGRPAGQFQIYGGDNVTVVNNKLLNGPPQASGYSANPPVFFQGPGVCGTQSGNTYWSGTAALPFRMGMLHQNGYSWPFPPC
ncbi:MAG TPA: right-handed parallel beta-helix repeat-containing protein [Acidimicrobiales bacterium]